MMGLLRIFFLCLCVVSGEALEIVLVVQNESDCKSAALGDLHKKLQDRLAPQGIVVSVGSFALFPHSAGLEKIVKRSGGQVRFVFLHTIHTSLMKMLKKYPKEWCNVVVWEPYVVVPFLYTKKCYETFSKIFTFDDRLVDGKQFIKTYYAVRYPMLPHIQSFSERKLCCYIGTNKKSVGEEDLCYARAELAQFFDRYLDFDLYGKGWEGFCSAKGAPEDAWATMGLYKFAFAYENSSIPGYITEKLFQAFAVGVVPIYLGAPNIEEYVPKNCFIDRRDFASYHGLYQYLVHMTEEEFNHYLENIRIFLESPAAKKFTSDQFVDTLVDVFTKVE